ncbi:transporter [Novosphingobium sp. G106]|uniref:transporter n=1 Tax=Novosphingobium sp. G106 TaxID=2849500 RepID=UPI001C2DCE54|nr:transporter [Novosphingobium sp. G106]MBV1691588.1 transporter [Novosphingobium sp. G106]
MRFGVSLSARLIALSILLAPAAALAGPPFLTDDPEPTETGHWEIYAPLFEAAGRGTDFSGSAGVEVNYGAAPNLQLTVGLPAAYTHDAGGWRWGAGDLEVSAKYRFYRDEAAGVQVAFFPGMTLPTGSNGMSAGRVTALLPIWLQKDAGAWSVFGGGGYAINPGSGNHDYWTEGVAVTRHLGDRLLLGVEADHQGADTIGGKGSTSLGAGAIYLLKAPFRVLVSGGPTFDDGGGAAGFHGFLALGVDF